MMVDIENLITFLRMLPDDTGMINWELTHDGCGCYTLTVQVRFTLPPGQSPPWPTLTVSGS
jgi:hypothetical protein